MDFTSLHELLRSTYQEMMPLCGEMTGIAKGIAGLEALFYVVVRVWFSLSRAEPIDLFPLLRPFVPGPCTMFFPTIVLGTMDTILPSVVQGTERMVNKQTVQLDKLIAKRGKLQEAAYLRSPETAYLVSNEAFDQKIGEMGTISPSDAMTIAGMYAERTICKTKQWLMRQLHDPIELLYRAAALIVDTLRAFFLVVLSVLGPIVFDIAVWDSSSGSLTAWFSHYISVYLWLSVSSVLSALPTKIRVLMVQKDVAALSGSNYLPDSGSWYYIAFFLIGIVGYFCVSTITGWIIEAGGGIGAYGRNVNQTAQRGAQSAYTGGRAVAGATESMAGNVGGRIRGAFIKGK